MAKTYTVNKGDTLESIVTGFTASGSPAKKVEQATLALLELNPQLDVLAPRPGMKLQIPGAAVTVSPRSRERYRVARLMQKGEQDIPVSAEYTDALLKKMEKTPTGRAVAARLREALKTGELRFVYKHAGNPVASFASGEKEAGVIYLDSRNFLGLNDPGGRAGKYDPVKGFLAADYFNVGLVLHEGMHFITYQARYRGTLKAGANTIADETVAYSAQYDFINELKKLGIRPVTPGAYTDPARLPWNKKVIEYERQLAPFRHNGKYDEAQAEFEANGSRLREAAERANNYHLFRTVRQEIKSGVAKGPLDYIALDRAWDSSYSNTANFLFQRLPAYWGKQMLSAEDRRKYHQDVRKIIDGLKRSTAPVRQRSEVRTEEDHEQAQQRSNLTAEQYSSLMHKKMAVMQQKKETGQEAADRHRQEMGI